MQIPALASALSRSLTHSDRQPPPADPSLQLGFHDRRTLYTDRSTVQSSRTAGQKGAAGSDALVDPFDVVLFSETSADPLASTLLDNYGPTSSIVSYSDGIILVEKGNAIDCILKFYDYDTLELKILVRIFKARRIIHIEVVSHLILFLTNDRQLILFDPVSCTMLSSLHLSYHFTAFKQVINLDDSRTDKKLALSLYASSSCCQLVQIDFSLGKLSLLSALMYLPFWPTSFLSIEHTFFYFFSSSGDYQIFSIGADFNELVSFPASRSPLLIDPKYGKLQDIYALSAPNLFIFLQENGWSIYQYQQPDLVGENKSKKVSNSLNNLQLVISSPLSSPYEKIVIIENQSFILMRDCNITLITDNHIQLVESKATLLDIFPDRRSSSLLGLCSDIDENKSLNTLTKDCLRWKEVTSSLHQKSDTCCKTLYRNNDFVISSTNDRIILQNIEGKEVGTLFDLFHNAIQVIDLNLVLGLGKTLKYFLVFDAFLNFQLLVLDDAIDLLLKTVKIAPLQDKSACISLVYYYEDQKLLEFSSASKKSVFVNLDDLLVFVANSKSKNSRLIIFDSTENCYFFNSDSARYEDLKKVPIDQAMKNSNLFVDNSWIGIRDNSQLAVYRIKDNQYFKYPQLYLLYTLVVGDSDQKLFENLRKQNSNLIRFVERVAQYCVANNSALIEASINTIYGILVQDHEMIKPLFEQCNLSKDDTLVNTVVMVLCISLDSTLVEGEVLNKLFMNIVSYALLIHERTCEICIDVLSKLNLENLRITEEQHGDDTFDLIEFFNEFLYVRSTLFNDRKKRNFKNFQKCNDFLNSNLEQNVVEFSIIIFTIIESEAYDLESKKCVLDYIVYALIEKKDSIECSGSCNTMVYLLVNSLFSFMSSTKTKFNKALKNDDTFWESLNLLFNVLTANFGYLIAAEYQEDWKKSVYNDGKNICVFVALDILGYIGIVFSKNEAGDWYMRPSKCSRLKLPRLDNEIGNENIDTLQISEIMKQNETDKGVMLQFKDPILFSDSKRMALVNMSRLSIQLWNLESDTFRDNMSIEVLKDDSIPLKIPDFNMLMFQYIWKFFSHENVQKTEKEGDHDSLTTFVERFHHEIVDKITPTISPLTSPKRKTQPPLLGYTYSQLATIYEPYGEHQFGFLLESYLKVFPMLKASDISIAVIESNSSSVQLQLTLRGQAIFVFTSHFSASEAIT